MVIGSQVFKILVFKMKPFCCYILLLLNLPLPFLPVIVSAEPVGSKIPDVLNRMWSLLSLRNELQKGKIVFGIVFHWNPFHLYSWYGGGKKAEEHYWRFFGCIYWRLWLAYSGKEESNFVSNVHLIKYQVFLPSLLHIWLLIISLRDKLIDMR